MDQVLIFFEANKEYYRIIICKSNLKDLIIFDEISIEGRYSIIIFMEKKIRISKLGY